MEYTVNVCHIILIIVWNNKHFIWKIQHYVYIIYILYLINDIDHACEAMFDIFKNMYLQFVVHHILNKLKYGFLSVGNTGPQSQSILINYSFLLLSTCMYDTASLGFIQKKISNKEYIRKTISQEKMLIKINTVLCALLVIRILKWLIAITFKFNFRQFFCEIIYMYLF